MQSVRVPPINLWNISSAMYLLLRFPLLVMTEDGEAVAEPIQKVYNQTLRGHIGTFLDAQKEVYYE